MVSNFVWSAVYTTILFGFWNTEGWICMYCAATLQYVNLFIFPECKHISHPVMHKTGIYSVHKAHNGQHNTTTCAHTHTRTHTRTHARTHARTRCWMSVYDIIYAADYMCGKIHECMCKQDSINFTSVFLHKHSFFATICMEVNSWFFWPL